jgi:hypothetical protein
MAKFHPNRASINDAIRKAAEKLLDRENERSRAAFESGDFGQWLCGSGMLASRDRARLMAIVYGKRWSPKTKAPKTVDVEWWRGLHKETDETRAAQLAAMADPARNPNEHERAVAAKKLAGLKTTSAPGLEEHERQLAEYDWESHRQQAEYNQQRTALKAEHQKELSALRSEQRRQQAELEAEQERQLKALKAAYTRKRRAARS